MLSTHELTPGKKQTIESYIENILHLLSKQNYPAALEIYFNIDNFDYL
jgi:hypothetical protein